jgi:hypothetical protein
VGFIRGGRKGKGGVDCDYEEAYEESWSELEVLCTGAMNESVDEEAPAGVLAGWVSGLQLKGRVS